MSKKTLTVPLIFILFIAPINSAIYGCKAETCRKIWAGKYYSINLNWFGNKFSRSGCPTKLDSRMTTWRSSLIFEMISIFNSSLNFTAFSFETITTKLTYSRYFPSGVCQFLCCQYVLRTLPFRRLFCYPFFIVITITKH